MGQEKNKKKSILNYTEMGSFFENMAMMVKSGISVPEAASLLKEETDKEDSHLSEALTVLSDRLEYGDSMGDAMKQTGAFPDYATDMISSSEYTGKLENTLFHLSGYYRTENSLKNTLTSAVRYPVILLLMVIAVLALMLALVFPAFYDVYNNLTGGLASSAYSYINVPFTLCKIMLVIMILLLVLILAGVYMWSNGKKRNSQEHPFKISPL